MNTMDELRAYEADLLYVWKMQLKGLNETTDAIQVIRRTIKEMEGEGSLGMAPARPVGWLGEWQTRRDVGSSRC